jgi:hypothetical protein
MSKRVVPITIRRPTRCFRPAIQTHNCSYCKLWLKNNSTQSFGFEVLAAFKNKIWDSRNATQAKWSHGKSDAQVEERAMQEMTLFWGLVAASLINVLFLCIYL